MVVRPQSGMKRDRLFSLLPHRLFGVVTNYTLIAMPLFVFMGVMLERSAIAEQLLDTMGSLEAVATGDVSRAGTAGAPGTAQLWPHLHSTDAMFMALFRKGASS